jgi:ubiquinone/menaquinone biosynthesis C-methylase UbiE
MLLEQFAARVNGTGRVCDLGCGPGHVAGYLHDRGVDIFGLDLSPGMLDQARKLNPNLEFQQGNMLALDVQDSAWSAIVAFYSIVHIPKADLPQALREMYRVLKRGGLLFLAFHLGDEVLHEENCWGRRISLDLVLFGRKESSAISPTLALLSKILSSAIPIPRRLNFKAAGPTFWLASPRQNSAAETISSNALHDPISRM